MLPETDLRTAAEWARLTAEIGPLASHGSAHVQDPQAWSDSGRRDYEAVSQALGQEPGPIVLDWGCVAGRLVPRLSERAQWVFAADVAAPVELEDLGNVSVVQTDIPEICAPAASLDTVISLHVLYSFTPDGVREAIRQLATLLAPGGMLVADVPYRFARDPFHMEADGLPGGWWVHSAGTLMNGELGDGLWLARAPEPIREQCPQWEMLARLSLWVWRKLR